MWTSLNGFKVIHDNIVLNALALENIEMPEEAYNLDRETVMKPKRLGIIAISEDGEIISILDEACRFQFIPIISR